MSRKVRARRGTVVGLAGVFVLGLLFGGCVKTYNGSRLEMNLSLGTGMQTSDIVVPTPGKRPGDAGYFSHYELFANIEDSGLVRLGVFLVRPVFATDNPCVQFLPDTFCRPGGQACPEYINPERFSVLEQIYGVVSAPTAATTEDASNPYGYDFSVGFDFMQWPDDLFQDPSLQDPAEKLARANLKQDAVEQFCSNLPPGYYVGNPALLAQPLHGDLFGPVDGADPRTGIQLGGITMWVTGKLHRLTQLIVIRETDPSRLSPENIDREDLLPSPNSQVFLIGRKDEVYGYIHNDEYRGVTTALLENPYALPITLHAVIFEDIDKDPIQF